VAREWLDLNSLNGSFTDQIVQFIITNVGEENVGTAAMNVDPLTGAGAGAYSRPFLGST
jgi:hypothetical protein